MLEVGKKAKAFFSSSRTFGLAPLVVNVALSISAESNNARQAIPKSYPSHERSTPTGRCTSTRPSFGRSGLYLLCRPSSALSPFAQHRLEGIPFHRWPTSPVRCRFDEKASNTQTQALVVHALLQSSSPTFDRLLHPNVRTTIQVNIHLGFLAHLHIFALHVLDKEHLKQQIFNT